MKQPRRFKLWSTAALCLVAISTATAALPSAWLHEQPFTVPAAGLVKLNLPASTLGAARPGLDDVRVIDDNGAEVPWWIARRAPATRKESQPAKSFSVSIAGHQTIIVLETGLTNSIDEVTLDTPARHFIKGAQIEGSHNGANWHTLSQGQPIFREPDGASKLYLTIPRGPWASLRLTVDDDRSQAIPFTGARVEIAPAASEPEATENIEAKIVARAETPTESQLTIDLGVANLDITDLQIQTTAPLFTRSVTVAVPEISRNSISEQPVARVAIFRIAVEGEPASENLLVPVRRQIRARQLVLIVKNGNSPPLPISSVRVQRRLIYLLFLAQHSGTYHLLTGNPQCAAPSYDVAEMNVNPNSAPVSGITLPAPGNNPDYCKPDTLPGITNNGAPLNVSAWSFRKPVTVSGNGAQELQLDIDVLANSQFDLRDVRLVQSGNQIPFILEDYVGASISATATTDSPMPGNTRWTIRMPKKGLPVKILTCTTETPLFRREMTLSQNLTDERGAEYRDVLAHEIWQRTPDQTNREFSLTIPIPLSSEIICLETHNGDNPPIELSNFRFLYPVPRLLFKSTAKDPVFLYYGNAKATTPEYDLTLVGNELLAAEKSTAKLGPQEELKGTSGTPRLAGAGHWIFWFALGAVVVVLLWLISQLLPKTPPQA